MQYRPLGQSGLSVSELCLGTMTFGQQNSEREAFEQMDYACAQGINFLDTAEMYPVPTTADTQGRTEEIIGNWLQSRGGRERIVLATKAAGPAEMTRYLRPDVHFDRDNLRAAVTASLQRLKTDYIDLYQLHWPDRKTTYFGQLGYSHQPEQDGTPLLETLQVLAELVQEGLIRHIGLSNETPWGLMKCLQLAEQHGLPRVATVQNPYSLLNRSTELALSEALLREEVALMAYSPMAFGVLSGKYLNGARPEGSRLALFPHYQRYLSDKGQQATARYVELAHAHGLDPAQMALAFVTSRDFVGSNIIGATSMAQLQSNIESCQLRLSPALLEAIEAIHLDQPNPCP
ncbi:NADP(H)-dependent aldo-keto reductase [Marinobacterium jannaschii]|uniref:NADP(H)-dependent aldo-keto reductase n=1 Tax=Marinobacterium jannaschii TaxID=64970 RepID=UPI0004838638|nr:NADP(H)-dependent aldo-keto reductase [Marinobacterium jannaschii]